MYKDKIRRKLYNCAKLYQDGLLSDIELKQQFSDYIITISNRELYKYLNLYLEKYEKELSYVE